MWCDMQGGVTFKGVSTCNDSVRVVWHLRFTGLLVGFKYEMSYEYDVLYSES